MTRSPRPRRRPPTTTITTSPTKISTASPTTAVTTPSPAPVPTTVVVSMTGATKQDYDDVAEVTTNIVIENTDLTSLAAGGLGSQSWCSSPGTCRSPTSATLCCRRWTPRSRSWTRSPGTWTSSATTFWLCSSRRSRFPAGGLLVTGYASIYNTPVLPFSLGSGFQGLATIKRTLHRLRQCRVGHAGMDAAFSNLGDGHGFT